MKVGEVARRKFPTAVRDAVSLGGRVPDVSKDLNGFEVSFKATFVSGDRISRDLTWTLCCLIPPQYT